MSNLRIVVEEIGHGFEAGYERDPDRRGNRSTNFGWYGATPVAALFRLLLSEAEAAKNLSEAVAEHAETMDALVQELSKRLGEDLLAQTGPRTVYEATGFFGQERISQVEAERNALAAQLDDLHRCEHHRRHGDVCVYCPGGMSVGGILDREPTS